MASYNAWRIISWVETFYYFGLSFFVIHLIYKLFHHRYGCKEFLFMTTLLLLAKIAAGVCGVVLLTNAPSNTKLTIAFIVLSLVALGIFMRVQLFLLKFVNRIVADVVDTEREESGYLASKGNLDSEQDEEVEERGGAFGHIQNLVEKRFGYRPTKKGTTPSKEQQQLEKKKPTTRFEIPFLEFFITNMIFAAIGLSAAGGGLAAGSSSSAQTGHTLAKVGVILYVASVVGIAISVAYKVYRFRQNPVLRGHQVGLVLWLQAAMLPLILVRIIYSVCSTFAGTSYAGTTTSKFSMLTGEWGIYLGMGFLEECIVMLLFIITGEVIVYRIG